MTELQIRQNFVNRAISYLGAKEGGSKHKEIIDTFNTYPNLRYKMTVRDPWCATAVSAWAIMCGIADIFAIECSCSKQIFMWKSMGRWQEIDSYIPKIGDILYYDWADNAAGDNKGDPDHVGVVTKISGDTITVIEGNKNNAVEYRTMKINGKYIRGYALPDYVSKATKEEAPKPSAPVETKPSVNKIDTVREVQQWANANYGSGLTVDGIYGAKTKRALVKILQIEINQTYGGKLAVDGIWGTKTRAACPTLRKGAKNDVVKALQALLVCNGYPKAYVDGDYGSGTYDATKSYQSKKGLAVDGIAGKNTFAKLCG